ncbi:ATP-binding protein [Candidatus Poriferisocius sp.]|uniref:ATP-binding protein n=1 Tax=Candidatus Poriferisocius sp. TaxID=3101276 RepID=UPI003B020243
MIDNSFLTPSGYIPRVAESSIRRALAAAPMVLLEGAKGCGKTWAGLSMARSKLLLDADANDLAFARASPRDALREGPYPKLVDEYQRVPELWNAIRGVCDEGRDPGRFVLTGSAEKVDDVTRHSGAGRLIRVRLRPMSLFETGHSTGEVSLRSLMAGEPPPTARTVERSLRAWSEITCAGGWPRHLGMPSDAAQRLLIGYLNETVRADLPLETGVRRDPAKVMRLMRSHARHSATIATQASLARDTAGDGPPLGRHAASGYLDAMHRLFVLDDLDGWVPAMRSKSVLRQSPKRHMVDPSLATAVLRAGPDQLSSDLRTLGLLFESLAIRDLRVYAEAHDMSVWHYHDDKHRELDAVIEHPDGRWMAVEVKLGGVPSALDDAAESLLTVACQAVKNSRRGPPAAHVLLTALGRQAYRRPDGVDVVPLSLLGP